MLLSRHQRGSTLAQLLEAWLPADQAWKPSTYVGYRSTARVLAVDAVGLCRAQSLTPEVVRQRLRAWEEDGGSLAVRSGRFRTLRACLSWAYNERLLDTQLLRLMRGPGRVEPRRPLALEEVQALLLTAELLLLEAQANAHRPGSVGVGWGNVHPAAYRAVHRAEQDLLLVRLAVDSGARRGELAALRFTDLTGPVLAGPVLTDRVGPAARPTGLARTLHIQRAVSAGQLTGRSPATTVP
ncbi:hypothetical protein JCM18899A_24840 [Nocardioides sp. AN3]